MKRLFDFIISILSLILLLPIFIVTGLLIAMTSGFPLFFVQRRIGRNGIPFNIFKFRTMHFQPEASRGSFHAGDKSRVTRIGLILRKTKLDELPQLWNVCKGDMSFVGPRPEVPQWVAAYPARWAKVHRVRPGITDNASIEFRDEETILSAAENPTGYYRTVILPRKLDLYDQYVDNHSFIGDLGILFRTFRAIGKPPPAPSDPDSYRDRNNLSRIHYGRLLRGREKNGVR